MSDTCWGESWCKDCIHSECDECDGTFIRKPLPDPVAPRRIQDMKEEAIEEHRKAMDNALALFNDMALASLITQCTVDKCQYCGRTGLHDCQA